MIQFNILNNLNFYNYRCWGKQGCFSASHLPAQSSYMDVSESGLGTGCSFLQSLFFTGRKNGQWFLKYTHAMFVGSNIKGTFNFEPFFCITRPKPRHISSSFVPDWYLPSTPYRMLRKRLLAHYAPDFRGLSHRWRKQWWNISIKITDFVQNIVTVQACRTFGKSADYVLRK